jgi:hypothetical protein
VGLLLHHVEIRIFPHLEIPGEPLLLINGKLYGMLFGERRRQRLKELHAVGLRIEELSRKAQRLARIVDTDPLTRSLGRMPRASFAGSASSA